jgi:hypothetical protein
MAGLMGRVSRRQVVRLGVLALPLTFAASSPYQVEARIGWCRRDPILEIDGKWVRIDVYSKKEIIDVATGPTKLHVFVPKQVDFRVVAEDEGFGKGWEISFDRREQLQVDKDKDTVEIQVEVFVPTPEYVRLPVKVLISDPGKIEVTDDGDVVDKGRDDKLLSAHGPSRGDDEEAWTSEWISLSPVTLK